MTRIASGVPALCAGIACTVAGVWLTLVSVGGWLLERMLPPGALATLARVLLALAGDVVMRAWPLALVALGFTLVFAGALTARAAAREGSRS